MSTKIYQKYGLQLGNDLDSEYKLLDELLEDESFYGMILLNFSDSAEIRKEDFLKFVKLICKKGKNIDLLAIDIPVEIMESCGKDFGQIILKSRNTNILILKDKYFLENPNPQKPVSDDIIATNHYSMQDKQKNKYARTLSRFLEDKIKFHNIKISRLKRSAEADRQFRMAKEQARAEKKQGSILLPQPLSEPGAITHRVEEQHLRMTVPQPEVTNNKEVEISIDTTEELTLTVSFTEEQFNPPEAPPRLETQLEAAPEDISKQIRRELTKILKNDDYWSQKTLAHRKPTTIKNMDRLLADEENWLERIQDKASKAKDQGRIIQFFHHRHVDTHKFYQVVATHSGEELLRALQDYQKDMEIDAISAAPAA